MTKQIKIEDLLPLLKPGWVAMDENGEWYWHEGEPEVQDDIWSAGRDCELSWLSDAFDIAPVEDWTKSLMKVRENDEKIELTCKQTLNLVIKDVPETWEELKKYVRSYISDIWVQDDFMQDRDLIIRENGTVELNDTQLMAGANITDMFLFICGVYGLKCNGIEEVRENENT